MNCRHFFLLMLVPTAFLGGVDAQAQVVVYKHVDATGRVTYSNQPMKGAVIVELSPLTVLPKSQTAAAPRSTATPHQASPPPTISSEPKQPPQPGQGDASAAIHDSSSGEPSSPAKGRALAVTQLATVMNQPAQQESLRQAPRSDASLNAATIAKQRRENVRRRILEGEIEAEAQLLSEAQSDLQREQTKSGAMRSLRAALLADERSMVGKKNQGEDAANTKMVIERHFERVRELQDQVSMHEDNLAELRSQSRAQPANQAIQSAQLRPVASTSAGHSVPAKR